VSLQLFVGVRHGNAILLCLFCRTMDGIKFGDTQMTVVGLFVAVLFLLISKSRPIAVLSEERPHRKLFSLPMLATISGQFAIHFWSLLQAVALSQPFGPR